ncbi:MAG: nucleotide disphospho-sugar-binding domain-containing protein [Solirubrobacterales bacterium]
MSRILAYTAPARGQLFPMIPILQELRERGHEIALRTLASEVGAMRELGFEAAPIAARIEALEMDDWRAGNPAAAMARTARAFGARAEHDARDLSRAIREEGPDAVMVDVLAWGGVSAAEAWGGPWACCCPFPLPLSSRNGPPAGPGLRPARGPLGHLRDRLAEPLFRAGLDRLFLPWLNAVREELGLARLTHAEEAFLAPPLLLYMTAEPFEYPRPDWPRSILMVGPCPWEPAGELPAELAELDAPLVLITTSTEFQDDGRLAQAALDGLAGEPFHAVATLPAADAARLRVPANATVLPFASHTPILARCACAITHGGMGATQKALALGVPVCVVPFGRDQPEVARRVEIAAAGSRLPAWRLSPARLRAKVHEAITRRSGAERLAAAFADAGGAPAAADALERLL